MELIHKYFDSLSTEQINRFEKLQDLYTEWNEKINVISRKDIDELYERHILHSLAIAKFITFKPGTTLLDIGTGGGFPSIPLAIFFPEIHITASDSIGKKITVVQNIIDALGLKNITAIHTRAEKIQDHFDFIVNRAVEPLTELHKHTYARLNKSWFNEIPNGIISLKGGDLSEEITQLKNTYRDVKIRQIPVKNYYTEPFFETKYVIYHTLKR